MSNSAVLDFKEEAAKRGLPGSAAKDHDGQDDVKVSAEPKPPKQAPPSFQQKPVWAVAAYITAGFLIGITQGLGISFITTNIQQIAGPMGLTQVEATWLSAVYFIPNVSLTLLLFKVRAQYGIRNFAEIAIILYVCVSLANLLADSYESALVLRFVAGIAAAPMSSLSFLYILEPFPPTKKMSVGLCAALTAFAVPTSLSGILSPYLLELGDFYRLHVVELGLAMISLGLVFLLPLSSPPRTKVIHPLDILSYFCLAVALACFAVVLTMGKLYWWFEAGWIGWTVTAGIVASSVFAVIELNRKNHLVDVRWLTSREILHFAGALMISRLLFAEQTSGAINFLRNSGMLTEQLSTLYWVILFGSLASGVVCAAVIKPGREPAIHGVSLLMVAIGSFIDSQSTIVTRPEQMYLSQFLVSFASGLFLPPALTVGMGAALKRGPNYILSFIVVFLATQKIGGYLASAIYGTFVQWREYFHSANLVSRLTPTDPLVAARLKQLSSAYGRVLTDPSQQSAQGTSLFSKQVQQQAFALAYNDAFLLTAWLSLIAFACLLIHIGWRHKERLFSPRPLATNR